MNELEQKLYDENVRLFNEAVNPLRSHGPDHHWRVYAVAKELAVKAGALYDADILAGAALLHDLAAYYPEVSGSAYHEHDHVLAEEALRRVGFPVEKIPATLDAIRLHGSDPKYKRDDEAEEITLVRDADKLDAFGPVGCARIVMVRTLRGDSLADIVKEFVTDGHLEQKWQSVSFPAAREMALTDYEYSKQFFASLENALA